jgi:WD40 repeat protein
MSIAASASYVAAGCENGKVKLFSFDGQESEFSGTNTAVSAVAFSADGAQIAAAGNNHTIDVWDVKSGKFLSSLEGHTQAVLSVAFSPSGGNMASGGADGTVRYWTQPLPPNK